MGRTFRQNNDYGCKHDYRERDDRKLKKYAKKLRKITKQKLVVVPGPREGVELV